MQPQKFVYVVIWLGKQALRLVENHKSKGIRILMHDEEIDKISTVYQRQSTGQYDPVQVKQMNGDLHTPKAIWEEYEAEVAMMRHIYEFSSFEGTPKLEENKQVEIKVDEEDEKMTDGEEEDNDSPKETKLDLYDRIELAVEAIQEYSVSIINETAYKNPAIDMETAKDMVDVPGDQDADMMYQTAMNIIEEVGGEKEKEVRRRLEPQRRVLGRVDEPEKDYTTNKNTYHRKIVYGIKLKEEQSPRGTKQLMPITISSQSSSRSTPALEELKNEKLPDWAMAMIDTFKALQKKVARVEREKLAAARVKERKGAKTEEPARENRRADSNRKNQAERATENKNEHRSTIDEVNG
ncbi:hypothetical protein P167DRAFT_578372 [Morchella conica CCBAS932]|uniref:Uncharacterized protein n=1 Tax=Morchella conica CCBAS932 TaxID=1392247 RepID=A0A3N4KD45_9PEZI|nr:hypothetical protein P167DRAFT_578372 [Morchella conica CCBAS932]